MEKTTLIIQRIDPKAIQIGLLANGQPIIDTSGDITDIRIVDGYATRDFFYGKLLRHEVAEDFDYHLIKVPLSACSNDPFNWNDDIRHLILKINHKFDYETAPTISILDDAKPACKSQILYHIHKICS